MIDLHLILKWLSWNLLQENDFTVVIDKQDEWRSDGGQINGGSNLLKRGAFQQVLPSKQRLPAQWLAAEGKRWLPCVMSCPSEDNLSQDWPGSIDLSAGGFRLFRISCSPRLGGRARTGSPFPKVKCSELKCQPAEEGQKNSQRKTWKETGSEISASSALGGPGTGAGCQTGGLALMMSPCSEV